MALAYGDINDLGYRVFNHLPQLFFGQLTHLISHEASFPLAALLVSPFFITFL